MNYVEEQKNELEALSEIYYNEIKVRSNKPPISFSIQVRPQASNYEEPDMLAGDDDDDEYADGDDDGQDQADVQPQCPIVDLLFKLPSKYPEEKPIIEVLSSHNLEEEELDELLINLATKSEESLGNVMIFTLVSDIVEWLSSKAEREANELEEQKNKKLEALEAEEKKKCHGMPVTVESFLAWKAKFDAELLKARLEQQKKLAELNPSGAKRLTGREMFETDKALAESDLNFVDDLEQDQLEALMQNIEEIELEEGDEDDDDDESDSEDYELGSDDEDFDSEEDLSNESEEQGTKGKASTSKDKKKPAKK